MRGAFSPHAPQVPPSRYVWTRLLYKRVGRPLFCKPQPLGGEITVETAERAEETLPGGDS